MTPTCCAYTAHPKIASARLNFACLDPNAKGKGFCMGPFLHYPGKGFRVKIIK